MPELPEALLKMLLDRAISLEEAKEYYTNFQFYEKRRLRIERRHRGRWAATVGERIYTSANLRTLERRLDNVAGGNRAYVERVGGGL